MRIRGAKTELESAGESTEGMAESTALLRQEIMALSGVDIMLNENTFKSTYQILDELSQKWGDLSDIAQASIIELVAGKHRGNVMASLMSNFDVAREALETSFNSSGSAMKEHAKWSESLEARLLKLKAAWQGLSQAFLNSNFLKGTLDGIIGLVDGITALIDTAGTLPTLFTAFAAFKSFSGKGFFKVIEDEATASGKRIQTIFGALKSDISNLYNSMGVKTNADFRNSLELDMQALSKYRFAINQGMDAGDAFNKHLTVASQVAQDYAKSGQLATKGVIEFERQQKAAQVTMVAQNNTLSSVKAIMQEYNSGCKNTAMSQKDFISAVSAGNSGLGKYLSGLNGAKASMGKYILSLAGAKVATIGLEIATMALNAALTMGVSALISLAISAVDKLIKTSSELAEEVEEVTSKFKEQQNELQKLKGDYDTTNESSMISKYEKLSKGVDSLGRNISLTAEEYSEYQGIVDKIAEQFPSLISGYDKQGNALLTCKGNVEALTEAYEKLIHAQNLEILTNTGDIEKNFKNKLEKSSGKHWWSNGHGFWAGILNSGLLVNGGQLFGGLLNYELKNDTVQGIQNLMNATSESEKNKILNKLKADQYSTDEIRDALTGAGIDVGFFESPIKVLEEQLEKDPQKIKGIVDDYYAQFTEIVDQQKTIATAKLSEAFDISSVISGLNYGNIGEELQAVAYQVVNSLDKDFFDKLQEEGKTVEQWTTDMLNQLNAIGSKDNAKIEAAFDLQAQFNGGKITYGEYVDGLKDTGKLVRSLGLDDEIETQLLLSLGLNEKGFVEEYQQLRNRLADDELFDISLNEYEPFLKNLSAEELSVLVDIIPELSESEYKETIDDVKSALRREMIVQGLTFDLNLEVESAGIEALNTALAESVSATGLSSDSISALKGRYSELESQGYDLSSMFEETSNGIHINREEFSKLEKAYATQKLNEVSSDLAEMKSEYNRIGEELKTCSDEAKAGLYNDRLTLAQKISEAATLASQYEGLTSAYNDWLAAEEAGQERDMYENIIEGFENVNDEISRGWIDDGTIEFLELLTGRTDLAGKSGKQLKEVYDGLDKTIGKSGYSIRDFFTVNEDGDSTNTGVYNFLETVESFEDKLGNVIKRKDKNIVGFDFEIAGGDEVIAETLGISKELVQIMVRAADDAGFVVSLDGTYRQLADLQNEAKTAANYLKEIGKTDFEFDFNTSNVEDLNKQLNEAHKILDNKDFWNKDGTFNFNADGAKQAMEVVSTLQAKLDYLTQDKYGIGLTVEDEEFKEPLENLQEYGRTVHTLNQLKLNPKVNSEEIEECETRLDELAQEFNDLDTEKKLEIGLEIEKGVALTQENLDKITDEKKIKLGFVGDDGKPLTNVVDVIQNKIESGEVTIPTVLDIQANMDKNIEKLADLAWLNSGFLTDDEEKVIRQKYNIEIEADKIDTSDVDEKTEEIVLGGGGGKFTLSRKANLEIIANTFGIEDVDDLTTKLKELDDKEIEAVAKVIGKIQVDELKQAVALLKPKEVEAIANAIGKGDVAELSDIIGQLSPKTVDAIANAFGYDNVNDLRIAIENLDPKTVEAVANALGITDVESLKAAIDNVKDKDVKVAATTSGEEKLSGLKKFIDSIKSKTVVITSWFKKLTSGGSTRNDSNGFSDVDGTANVNGTTGRAFKQGSWGTKSSGTALVGELGRETLVRQGRYYTIGDNGAEFIKYQKGDIIFNHRQTEELFANGKVTSNGGRAKAFIEGTAFSEGSGGFTKVTLKKGSSKKEKTKTATKTTTKSTDDKTTITTTTTVNSGGSKATEGGIGKVEGKSVGSDKTTENKFEETIDWIETILDRAERAIDKYEKQADNVYKTWDKRNKALQSEINEVGNTISLYEQAKKQYLSEANSVGLSESYASKVRDGSLSVEDFEGESDEKLVEKIKNYQDLYEKYLDCIDKIDELKEKEASLYSQRFDNVRSEYDNLLHGFDHTQSMLEEYINQAEEKGYIVSKKYYEALIDNEEDRINTLKKERVELIKARDEAVANNEFDEYSEDWYRMCEEIDSVTQSIESAETATIKWGNAIDDIDLEIFDLIQKRVSDITDEADFFVELMSNKKLFDDDGKLTSQGFATMGLHAQNYNTYMYQADLAGEEAERLKKKLEITPYDTNLEEDYREMIALQREYILAAEDSKNAIVDLVQEGIELEIDALDEKIQKYKDSLDSAKDLYDYQKRVEKQTKEISSLQKQLSAYEGDNSEEAKAKIQELRVSLEDAEDELYETELDRYFSQQEALLDYLYTEYELILNERLDNVDFLLSQVIDTINAIGGTEGVITTALGSEGAIALAFGEGVTGIKTTLETEADAVGVTISDALDKIWSTGDDNAKSILSMYGEAITGEGETTLQGVLNSIKTDVAAMVDDVDKDAQKQIKSSETKPAAQQNPAPPPVPSNNGGSAGGNSGKPAITNDVLMGIAAAIWTQGKKAGWENNPNRKNKLVEKLGANNAKKVQQYINEYGASGGLYKHWYGNNLKLANYSYSAFRLGAKKIDESQLAWTQEQGQEYIVRPSDGAILTPIAKGDSVLTSAATNNIWQMANSPAEFIKDNLNLGNTNVPNNSSVQNSVTQNFDQIVFSMPNVKNYDEMLAGLQKDPNFERLVESMSIGKLAGRSSLAKGKAIR